jgi:hypothetical protein
MIEAGSIFVYAAGSIHTHEGFKLISLQNNTCTDNSNHNELFTCVPTSVADPFVLNEENFVDYYFS